MAGFIAKQPNGLYCRFSTVVDTITHYNMTREDYINNVTGTVKDRDDGIDTLENYLKSFNEVMNSFAPNNMNQEEFNKIIQEMSIEPKEIGFKTT